MSALEIQRFLYFKTTHGTNKLWSYIAGGPKIKVIYHRKLTFRTRSSGLKIKGGLKIEGCKVERLFHDLLGEGQLHVNSKLSIYIFGRITGLGQ